MQDFLSTHPFVFNLVVTIALSTLFYLLLVEPIKEWVKKKNKRGKIHRMAEKLRQSGVRFRLNTDSGVTAICRNEDFRTAVNDYMSKVGTEQGQFSPWRKVSVRVKPTFTFAESKSSYRSAHTGTRRDLVALGEQLVEKLTGESIEEFDLHELDRLVKIITVQDGRLFVPFAGKTGGGAEMFSFYGYTTLEEAEKLFFAK